LALSETLGREGSAALVAACALLTAWLITVLQFGPAVEQQLSSSEARSASVGDLSFVPNRGQADARIRYTAHAGGFSSFFAQKQAVVALRTNDGGEAANVALALRFIGADPDVTLTGSRPTEGKVNYLIGRDPARWRTGLPTYGEITYRELWPGIDLVFRGARGQLKYEFLVRPGARVTDARLALGGAEGLSLDRGGNLRIRTAAGTLTDRRPVSYQVMAGKRVPVGSRFVLGKGGRVGFVVGAHDPGRTLVIDPGLVYSTLLGGAAGDLGIDIAIDAAGSAYVTGETASTDFPSTAGSFDQTFNGSGVDQYGAPRGGDAFVTKLAPDGSALVYSTYIGGDEPDVGSGIAVDDAGNAYVSGATESADFPTTAGAYDTSPASADAFVAKLNPEGSGFAYSTLLGGSSSELSGEIAVGDTGSAYVTGTTNSDDFPATTGAFDTSYNTRGDAFVTKLNPLGSALDYSTFLGGGPSDSPYGTGSDQSSGIALDGDGSVYVSGRTDSPGFPTTAGAFDTSYNGAGDGYVTKLTADGTALSYSTFLGAYDSHDYPHDIAVDAASNAYLAGDVVSPSEVFGPSEPKTVSFPTTPGAFDTSYNGKMDAFVTKLSSDGSTLAYSTFLGASLNSDEAFAIATDAAGSAYVTGQTCNSDFPTTTGAFDTTYNPVACDAFVTKLNGTGSALAYSTFLGSGGIEAADYGFGIAVNPSGSVYVTGKTQRPWSGQQLPPIDFPTTSGAFDNSHNDPGSGYSPGDAFVTKFDLVPTSTPGCYVRGTGRITTANGDTAAFGVRARVSGSGRASGQVRYRDYGSAQPLKLNGLKVLALACSGDGTEATIVGEATLREPAGQFRYEIRLKDLGRIGRGIDQFGIAVLSGYSSGDQTLDSGHIRIRTG
jgi:beta-propeller repeat-containing protein